MQLSKRMHLLASKVTEGNRLADVGTDHGYIPIALVLENKIPSAIAMDVNRGPLQRAEEHIRTYGLDTYIETRLSDGLHELRGGEADTILAAGMGGALTVRILSEGAHCLHTVKELILQPQSEIYLVRKWLYQNRFRIAEEDIVLDDGKYYPMIKAVHGQAEVPDEPDLFYGDIRIQRSADVLADFLKREAEKNEKIIKILREKGQENTARMNELAEKKERLHIVLGRLLQKQAADAERGEEHI